MTACLVFVPFYPSDCPSLRTVNRGALPGAVCWQLPQGLSLCWGCAQGLQAGLLEADVFLRKGYLYSFSSTKCK